MATIDELFTAIKENNQQLAIDIVSQLSNEQLIIGNKYGFTLFHYMRLYYRKDVVKTILERLSDEQLIIKDRNGYAPLHYVIMGGNNDIVKTVIERLSDEHLVTGDFFDKTPLHIAAYNGNKDIVKTLVDRLSNEHLVLKDYIGYTPLHYATYNGNNDIVKILLDRSSDDGLIIKNICANGKCYRDMIYESVESGSKCVCKQSLADEVCDLSTTECSNTKCECICSKINELRSSDKYDILYFEIKCRSTDCGCLCKKRLSCDDIECNSTNCECICDEIIDGMLEYTECRSNNCKCRCAINCNHVESDGYAPGWIVDSNGIRYYTCPASYDHNCICGEICCHGMYFQCISDTHECICDNDTMKCKAIHAHTKSAYC